MSQNCSTNDIRVTLLHVSYLFSHLLLLVFLLTTHINIHGVHRLKQKHITSTRGALLQSADMDDIQYAHAIW